MSIWLCKSASVQTRSGLQKFGAHFIRRFHSCQSTPRPPRHLQEARGRPAPDRAARHEVRLLLRPLPRAHHCAAPRRRGLVPLVRLIYALNFTENFLLCAPTARSRRVVDFSLVTLEISPSYCGVLAETSWKLYGEEKTKRRSLAAAVAGILERHVESA